MSETENNAQNFDDAPVSGGGATFLEILEKQLAVEKQEQAQAESDLNLPLSEKIKNKNWKVRKSALDELAEKVNELTSFDPNIFKMLSQILTEQHQGNLEEAVNIVNSFLEKNIPIGKECQPELNIIIKLLIEKCYSSSKQALKDKSKDMIISFIEYLTSTETLVDNLITIMQSRNQKMSQGGVSITTIILTLFGDKVFNYKKISSALTALSDKCSPLIKQNIVEFFIELYKWVKKQVYPLIDKKVKDTIKKDIEKGIEQIEKQFGPAYFPDPTKFIGNKTKVDKNSNKNLVEDNGDIVMNDQTEIDIFTKKFGFDDKLVEKMLKPECKWKEKKDAFDQLTELLNPEKLKRKVKNTNRANFIDMVKQLLKQPNQSVKHSIIRSMGNLCLALGNNFTIEAKELFPRIIENLSINKLSIINDIISTLINFSNIIDNNWVSEALIKYGSKSNICNIAKTNLCTLIEKLLDNKNNNNDLNCYIPTVKEIVIKYMDDHSQEIRNTSAKLMAYIKNNKINLFNNNVIKKELNQQKLKKIEEFDKGINKQLGNNKSINNNMNNPNVLNINNNINNFNTNNNINNNNENINENININNTSFDKNSNPDFIPNKKIQNKNNNRSRNENRTKLSTSVSADNVMIIPIEEINLSNKEDIINTVKLSVGEELANLFESKKWQEKKQGFVDLKNYFIDENNNDILNTNCEYFLKFILLKNKSFKENNIVIFKESLLCINSLIEVMPSFFTKKFYNPLLKLIIERLSERKIQSELTMIFENMIEKTSPKEIILALMKYIRDKTVPILNGGAILLNNLIIPNKENSSGENNNKIRENINLYPIREIIEFCCFLENNTNTQCRNSGTNILCSLYTFLGNNIKPLLKDLKESTMKSIEEKFEKIQVIMPNNNTSTGKISNNILEQVFPRIDISKKIAPNMIKILNEGKWTEKKEVINNIENIIISTNNKIQPKGLNELFNSIKFNLKDSNKNIVKMVMKLIEELAASLGSAGFRQYQKQIIPGIISNFADKNTQVKEESIKCIVKLISIMGFDSMALYFPNFLNIDNYEMKHEILNILIKNKNFVSNKKDIIKEYAGPLLNCLLDKNGIIRTMAEEISQEIVKYHGIQIFNDEIKKLKTPTVINQVKLILNRISKIVNLNNENANSNNINNKKSFKSFNRNSSGQQNIEMNNDIHEVNEFKLNNNNNNFMKNNNYDMMNNLENNIGFNNMNNAFNQNQRNNIFNQNSYNNNFNNTNSFNLNNNINNNMINQNQPISNMNQINQNILSTGLNFRNLSLIQQSINNPSEISFILNQLYSSDINIKFQSLSQLQNIIKNNESVLTNKIVEEIFMAFNTLLSMITKSLKSNYIDDLEIDNLIESNQDIKLLKYLLDVYSLLSSQYKLMNNLSNENVIYECYERLFIIITEKSLISYQYGTNLIQNLNSIIMNFFSNCNVTLSITSLIKLALNYKSSSDDFAQVCTLAIKGLDKFRNFIPKLNSILDMKKIFEILFLFFSEFEKTNVNLIPHNINEENTLNIVNSLIMEFIKIYGERVWGLYHSSLDEDMKRIDVHFKRAIELNLKEYNQSQVFIDTNSLKEMAQKYNFNNNNNNENIDNNIISSEDKTNVMYYINRLKNQGSIMSEEEKTNCYNEIVSLLHQKNEPITSISTKLSQEYYSKIYELYHSFNNNISNKPSELNENNSKNKFKPKLSISNGQKENKQNSTDFTLTEQAKRIQEYKNKFNSLTERSNMDNSNDVFNNNKFGNNFNFKGKINDENNQINGENDLSNNNILFDLENRKRQLDELSKGNNGFNSKTIFNSQSDIPVMNNSYLTGNIFGNQNNYSNLSINNDNNFMSQSSKNYELVKNMKKNLDHIRLRVTKNLNK